MTNDLSYEHQETRPPARQKPDHSPHDAVDAPKKDEASIAIVDRDVLGKVFGACDEHLRTIRRELSVKVTVHDGKIHLRGPADELIRASRLFEQLQQLAARNRHLTRDDVIRAISEIKTGGDVSHISPLVVMNGREVRARTAGQARYIESMRSRELVLCVGPAGTGKTYLAVARAVEALRSGVARKLVLVRPAVEAGESLGFLPGDLHAKINPYLRPLFDALSDLMERDMLKRYMEDDLIEVVPLAYMRGRTLNHAYIILDEAQNTTVSQMKMFLTRMGDHSRIIICGDTSQIDLPGHKKSGMIDALSRFAGIPGIGIVSLFRSDIVRHPLVQRIVDAYEPPNPS